MRSAPRLGDLVRCADVRALAVQRAVLACEDGGEALGRHPRRPCARPARARAGLKTQNSTESLRGCLAPRASRSEWDLETSVAGAFRGRARAPRGGRVSVQLSVMARPNTHWRAETRRWPAEIDLGANL